MHNKWEFFFMYEGYRIATEVLERLEQSSRGSKRPHWRQVEIQCRCKEHPFSGKIRHPVGKLLKLTCRATGLSCRGCRLD